MPPTTEVSIRAVDSLLKRSAARRNSGAPFRRQLHAQYLPNHPAQPNREKNFAEQRRVAPNGRYLC